MSRELEQFLDELLLEASESSTGTAKYLDADEKECEVTIADLILNGADPDVYYVTDGLTPIMLCALNQNLEGYKILADISSFEIQSVDGSTILHHAIKGGNDEIIEDIISRAPGILDAKNMRNQTPIMCAIKYGRDNALEMLLRAGVDPNSYSKYLGNQRWVLALAHAISCDKMSMVKLLINYGAWVDQVICDEKFQRNNPTLLKWCVMNNKQSAINIIVSCLSRIAERPDHADLAFILGDLEINPEIRQYLNKENTAMIAVILGEGDLIMDEYEKRLEESGNFEEAFSEAEKKLITDLRQFKEKLRNGLELLQENPDMPSETEIKERLRNGLELLQKNPDMPSEIVVCMVMIDLTKDVMEESCFSNKYPEFSRARSEVVNNYIENFKNPSKKSKAPSPITGNPSVNSSNVSCIIM